MSSERVYYFDNNATTRVAPEVVEAMVPFLTERWGNPASAYRFGHDVAPQVDAARERVAALIGAAPKEIIFTSCGTESINTAIYSACLARPAKRHLITTAVEHSATLKCCEVMRRRGYQVTRLPVDRDGALDLHRLDQAIRPDTAIVSVMWANNETGVIFPVAEAAAICRSRGVPFHSDAVQAASKERIDVHESGADFLSLSAHKLHAPKGIGALYVRAGTKFHPYLVGGPQERGRRAGTENVPSIVAFGRAAELALRHLDDQRNRVRSLRDHLETTILARIPGATLNGAPAPRLSNTTNIAFEGVEAEAILILLDREGICASSGSACTTGSLAPSLVLTAMGLTPERARSSVRFSLGVYTTREEVDFLLLHLPGMVSQVRLSSPLPPRAP
jgi:cysteine desulfurase